MPFPHELSHFTEATKYKATRESGQPRTTKISENGWSLRPAWATLDHV